MEDKRILLVIQEGREKAISDNLEKLVGSKKISSYVVAHNTEEAQERLKRGLDNWVVLIEENIDYSNFIRDYDRLPIILYYYSSEPKIENSRNVVCVKKSMLHFISPDRFYDDVLKRAEEVYKL